MRSLRRVTGVPALGVLDPSRPARFLPIVLLWLLVFARSAVFLFHEQAYFDSDQAIVGLMAKHLADGRAFPLFFYGQSYLLGVDAWLAAPVFLVFGASVAALHASLVLTNLAAVTLIYAGLRRSCRLGPWSSLAALVPLALAAPEAATTLIGPAGSAGPFLYSPRSCGCCGTGRSGTGRSSPLDSCTGSSRSTRCPPCLPCSGGIGDSLASTGSGRGWWPERRRWPSGRGSRRSHPTLTSWGRGRAGRRPASRLDRRILNLTARSAFVAHELPARAAAMLARHLPRLFGAAPASGFPVPLDGRWLFWPLAVGLVVVAARAAWLLGSVGARPRGEERRADFALYLLLVGLLAIAGYVAARPAGDLVVRYLVLALLAPVGLTALVLLLEPRGIGRLAAVGLVVVMAAGAAQQHWRLAEFFAHDHSPDTLRALGNTLLARGVHVAEAPYWRAYKLTFLMDERVEVASSDVVRITEYQRRAQAEGNRLVVIRDAPCPGGEDAGPWYLCHP